MSNSISISVSDLWSLILAPTPLRIVDVCLTEDAAALGERLPASVRHAHSAVAETGADVIVCHRGLKLSQGAAALLRADGRHARFLEGGMVAWQDAGLPTLRENALSRSGLYVCGASSFVQASLCRWFVQRLLPHGSTLLTVDDDLVATVCEKFDAVAATNAAELANGIGRNMHTVSEMIENMLDPAPQVARMQRGVEYAYGRQENGQLAMTPLIDALMAGSPA